ncbi:unnamed protein product [Calypogeia fissa]
MVGSNEIKPGSTVDLRKDDGKWGNHGLADKPIPHESAIDADMESIKSSDASLQEGESPTSQTVSPTDTPKETESPRFQALLRMTTGPRKKKNNDIKSYSHELDPKGVRSHDFWKSHSFNDLEKILEALRARFNSAKEEVNNELEVFAGDLVEILEKNANQPAEWQEKAEDILVLARQCTLMSPTEFRKHCESIVQDLDDKRQVLPMGILKQLHTRMLFILTRCTRLLQFQKVNGLEEEKTPTHKSQQLNKVSPTLDRAWTTTTTTPAANKRNNHAKGKGIVAEAPVLKEIPKPKTLGPSPPLPVLDKSKRVDKRKDEGTSSSCSVKIEKSKPCSIGLKSATLRQEKVTNEVDSLIADRLASWRKFTTSSDGSRASPVMPSTPDSARVDSESKAQSRGLSKRDLQVQVDRDDGASSLTRNNSGQSSTPSVHTPSVQHRLSWGYWGDQSGLVDDSYMVICRICEEEVPTVVLEEHSRVCACADRCDLKSLGIDDRLKRLAETLEKMLESCPPKTPHISASGSPDPGLASGVTERDGSLLLLDGSSSLNRRNSEDMLEDLHEIDAASIDGNFNPKTRFGPRCDSGMASSSGGSLTPRSPLMASRTNSLDQVLAPDRSSLVEPGDPMQMNELADIARCVANTNPGDFGSVEYIVSCMQDLNEVLQHNKVEARTVDTFGKRIAKLLREKYQVVAEAAEQNSLDAASSMLDDDVEEDRFPSSKSTPVHPSAYKDRTTIDDFEIIKPISRGAFGRVFLARKRTTGDLFAIKVLRKVDMIRKNAVESVQAERNILIHARNPFVVRFFYSFTCRDNLYLVMEYLNGGDLYSMLRSLGCLEEEMARVYIAELVLALEYLHSLGVVHRDLKPDNLLIAHDGHIKLTDFGLSRVGLINSTDDLSGPAAKTAMQVEESFPPAEYAKQRERRQQQSAVGTPDYLAPEILLGTGHGTPADWWSTGVILFEFLTGIPPFNAEHPQIIFDNILNRNIPWPQVPDYMSYEAQDLIDKLLREDPNERLGAKGAKEVKAHPFFKDINWDTLARQKAAFVPSPDTAHDTSYFTSRHMWSSADGRVFPEEEFGDSSDYESSSNGGSSGSLETRPEEGGDEYREMTEFESTPVGKYTFSNFSFKNLSQLASINYDLLIQTGGKDNPKDSS